MSRTPDVASARPARLAALASWALLDQSLSSLTNVALGILVARAAAPAEFGAFSLAFTSYVLALGVARALSSEPLAVRYSAASSPRWLDATASAAGIALVVGLCAGAACALAGWIAGGTAGGVFVTLAVLLPGLLVQDVWRYAFFAHGRGRAACVNDFVWALVLLVAVLGLEMTGRTSAAWLIFAWGGSANAAALTGVLQARTAPAPQRVVGWLRAQRDLGPRYLGEFAAVSGSGQLAFYGIGAVGGLVAAGSIRASQILLGPLNVLFLGTSLVAVPWGVRTLSSSVRRLRDAAVVLSAALVGVSVAWGVVLLALPDRAGVQLLGRSWAHANPLFLPLALSMAGLGAATGPATGLRSLAAARRSLRAQLLASPLVVVGGVAGAAAGGALGAAWGLALGYWAGAGIWWRQFNAAVACWQPEDEPSRDGQVRSAPPLAFALEGADASKPSTQGSA